MCARLCCLQTRVSGFLCLLAEGHCAWSHSTDLGRPLSSKGECNHVPSLHFADQPRVAGNVDPKLLLSPPCRERILTTGHSPWELLESHTTVLQKARGVTGTSLAPDCSASLLTLATLAISVSLTDSEFGCEFGPFDYQE